MGKVEENKIQKKSILLNTAFSLFSSEGIAHTSIANITKKAGIAKGTFYLYFRDKYDLQEQLIALKAGHLFQHAMKNSGFEECEDPIDQVITIIDDILEQMQKNKALLRFINKNLSWGLFRSAMNRSEVDYMKMFCEIIPDLQNTTKVELLVYTITELVGASCYSVILDSDPVDFATYKPFLNQSIRAIIEESLKVPK